MGKPDALIDHLVSEIVKEFPIPRNTLPMDPRKFGGKVEGRFNKKLRAFAKEMKVYDMLYEEAKKEVFDELRNPQSESFAARLRNLGG